MIFNRRIIAAAALSMTVTGCTATDPNMGNSVRQTMAAQIVNPDPDYQGQPQTTAGTQAATAVERYRTGTVKKPDRVRTTTGTSGAGSSGSPQ
ncbi:MAG: hypothetical protein RLZZ58_592 [Pseudomonadota bacterium]